MSVNHASGIQGSDIILVEQFRIISYINNTRDLQNIKYVLLTTREKKCFT